MQPDDAALTVTGVSKTYGSQLALDSVSLTLAPGEIAALLGENGAGKSTLARILAGAVAPDQGDLTVAGKRVRFHSPRDALTEGIALIPQELIYVPQLSVAENICLGRLPAQGGVTGPGAIQQRGQEEMERFGFDLPLNRTMDSLPLAAQQQVEILKALARDSRIVLLDEPTAALSAQESERLLDLTRTLAARGVGVIYISHRLDEVISLCDTVHILRNGRLVQSSSVADTNAGEIVRNMLGRPAEEGDFAKSDGRGNPIIVQLTNLSRRGLPQLNDISLAVHRGEVVGLYGVAGSGAETVAEALGGLHPDVIGRLRVGKNRVERIPNPSAARRLGIAYLPADRKSQGLVSIMPILRAFSLPVLRLLSRFGIVSARREGAHARRLAQEVQLRARDIRQTVGELSGGNQQKVLVGSRLSMDHKVLVLHEPTRGVDVGARYEIHRLLRSLAAAGTGQLIVTSDIEESVALCDRVLVVRNGAIVHEVEQPHLTSQSEILRAAGGVQ